MKKWTEYEINYIKYNIKTKTIKQIAIDLARSESSIYSKISKLNIEKNFKWTDEEIKKLIELYPLFSNKELSEKYFPNVKPNAIRTMANSLHLKKEYSKNGLYGKYQKQFDNDEILYQLKKIYDEIGRVPLIYELKKYNLPSESTFIRYFGGYRNACIGAGVRYNISIFNNQLNFKNNINGDIILSKSELFITNYFIENNISYRKEVFYNEFIPFEECGLKKIDWVVKDYVIEFFGMMNKKEYKTKALKKISLCKKYNLKLIELYPEDLKNLDYKLSFLKYI